MVLHKITWPHELVYMAAGQPAMYDELSIALFISGYLSVKQSIKPLIAHHLEDLMADAELYG